jgi:hypothetical protein
MDGNISTGSIFNTNLTSPATQALGGVGNWNDIKQSKISNNIFVAGSVNAGRSDPPNIYQPRFTSASYDQDLNLLGYQRASTAYSPTSAFSVYSLPSGGSYIAGNAKEPVISGRPFGGYTTMNESGGWPSSTVTGYATDTAPSTLLLSTLFNPTGSSMYWAQNRGTTFPVDTRQTFAKVDIAPNTVQYAYQYSPFTGTFSGISTVTPNSYVLLRDLAVYAPQPAPATPAIRGATVLAMNESNGDNAYRFYFTSTTNTLANAVHINQYDTDLYITGTVQGVFNKYWIIKTKSDLSQLTSGLTATVDGINITVSLQSALTKTSTGSTAFALATDYHGQTFSNVTAAPISTTSPATVTQVRGSI